MRRADSIGSAMEGCIALTGAVAATLNRDGAALRWHYRRGRSRKERRRAMRGRWEWICQQGRGFGRKVKAFSTETGGALKTALLSGDRAPYLISCSRKEENNLSISAGPVKQGNSSQDNADIHAPLIPAGRLLPFMVVTVLFFLWAIPNNLNDILIRQFMKSFNISRSSAASLQIWFYLAYALLAWPAAQLMRRFGYKTGIVTGLCLLGSGCLLFYPAAQAGIYAFFLVAQFVIASGLSFLETGSNSFIAQLGPAGSSERRLNLSQAFNPLGSICAGLIGTVFIFSGVTLSDAQVAAMRAAGTYQTYLHSETLRVVTPYLVLGCIAFLWALLILLTRFPALSGEEPAASGAPAEHVRLMQPHFVFAVLAQFLYVGAQIGTWSYFINYAESATGVGDKAAGYMLTGTLAAFAVGRFSSAWLMRHFHARLMLVTYAVINVVLCLFAVVHPSWLGVGCLLMTSLFMSIMFPTIFALGLKGMGEKTKTAGSFLVMALLGGAVLTKLMGMLPLRAAYLVPLACYVGVALYAWLFAEAKTGEAAG
jgi:FHS family L-fucose permease-like MFS transporter